MAYNLYDLQNALQQAQESIEEAIDYAEELEDYEERVDQLEEDIENYEERIENLNEQVEQLEEEIVILRDASNLQDLIKWWLNNLNEDSKYKVWELAYHLMMEEQEKIELILSNSNE